MDQNAERCVLEKILEGCPLTGGVAAHWQEVPGLKSAEGRAVGCIDSRRYYSLKKSML